MIAAIEHWLLSEGPAHDSLGELVRGLTRAFNEHGVPLSRVFLGPLVLHPQAAGLVVIYDHASDSLREFPLLHETYERLHAEKRTPMAHIINEETPLRAALHRGEDLGMEDLAQLRDQGFTDFIAVPIHVGGRLVAGMTLTTQAPTGFSADEAELLVAMTRAFGPVSMLYVQRFEQRELPKAYLGADAGERVRAGQVRRGQGRTLRAAIAFFDMRGFTQLSASHPRDEVLDLLNDVFAVLVAEVQAQGGEVLKFMGDGMLAVFLDEDPAKACHAALASGRACLEGVDIVHARRIAQDQAATRVGIGLHHGDVMYGNIGAPGRLDFTVIGPAVNLAARVEALCRGLGEELLMTSTFAGHLDEPVASRGAHPLKGVDAPVEVFALPR